jgi:hypothetical protein
MRIELTPVMVGVIMPGGFHYEENGKMIVDDAVSYEDLINKLAEYRAVNGLLLGNPQADIDNYICNTYPNMCGRTPPVDDENVDKIELSYGQPVVKSPRERSMQWAVNRIQGSGQIELVDQEEAERRAAICDGCPKKIQWNAPVEGCPGCDAYVQEAESMLVKLRANKSVSVPIDGQLCSIAGHDLQTAVWLEEPALRHRRNYTGKFPQHCWLNEFT